MDDLPLAELAETERRLLAISYGAAAMAGLSRRRAWQLTLAASRYEASRNGLEQPCGEGAYQARRRRPASRLAHRISAFPPDAASTVY
jgi:hypothetical protein